MYFQLLVFHPLIVFLYEERNFFLSEVFAVSEEMGYFFLFLFPWIML